MLEFETTNSSKHTNKFRWHYIFHIPIWIFMSEIKSIKMLQSITVTNWQVHIHLYKLWWKKWLTVDQLKQHMKLIRQDVIASKNVTLCERSKLATVLFIKKNVSAITRRAKNQNWSHLNTVLKSECLWLNWLFSLENTLTDVWVDEPDKALHARCHWWWWWHRSTGTHGQ